jgi:hypothetical protein
VVAGLRGQAKLYVVYDYFLAVFFSPSAPFRVFEEWVARVRLYSFSSLRSRFCLEPFDTVHEGDRARARYVSIFPFVWRGVLSTHIRYFILEPARPFPVLVFFSIPSFSDSLFCCPV